MNTEEQRVHDNAMDLVCKQSAELDRRKAIIRQMEADLQERDAYAVNLQKTLEMLRAWLVGRVGSAPYISAIDAALAKNLSTPLAVSAETPRSRSPGTTGADTLAAGGTNSRDALTGLRVALRDERLVREIAMQVRPYMPIGPDKVEELLGDIRQGIAIYIEERVPCEEQKHG